MAVGRAPAYTEPCRNQTKRNADLRCRFNENAPERARNVKLRKFIFDYPTRQRSTLMNRRDMLARTGTAALTLGLGRLSFPLGWTAAADTPKRRLLMFTRSQTYEHDVVKRPNRLDEKFLKEFGLAKDGKLSLAESIVTELGE